MDLGTLTPYVSRTFIRNVYQALLFTLMFGLVFISSAIKAAEVDLTQVRDLIADLQEMTWVRLF